MSKDYTNWIVSKDLTHNALYYRTYNHLTVRVIYLDKVQPQGKRLKLSLSTPVGGFKDATDELKTVDGEHTELQGTELGNLIILLIKPGASNENIVQNHLNIALLNVFRYLSDRYRHIFIP